MENTYIKIKLYTKYLIHYKLKDYSVLVLLNIEGKVSHNVWPTFSTDYKKSWMMKNINLKCNDFFSGGTILVINIK